MNDTTSGAAAILGEVVAAAPDAHLRPCGTHAAIKRHRRRHEPLCDSCATYERDYNRDYYRAARNVDTFRLRHNAHHRERMRRLRADPATHAALNAQRRQRRLEARQAALHDAKHGIDEVVVLRLIGGERLTYNRAERIEAVRQLRERGMSYQQIADRIGVAERRVHRDLAHLGMTSQGAVA